MILHIFRRENQTDFERIEVFVVGFRDKSIDIKNGKQIVTLSWNSEYTIEDLLYDDILNIYIKGDDFTKGYILPILHNLSLNDLDEFLILESILSKRDQIYRKEMEIESNILKKIIEHGTKRSIDDFKLFQELLKSVSAEERNFDMLKDLVNKNKLKLNESKEKESIKNKLNKLNPEEILSLPHELEMSLDILLSDVELEKGVFTITEKVMQAGDQKKDLTLTEKIQIKWTPEISSLCYSAKNVYNFGNFVMRKLFFIKNKNPNCTWDDFLKIRQSIMPDPLVKDYAQKREILLGAFGGLKEGIRYKDGTRIKNSLNTLLKFSKFYNDTGYAQISQQILQVLGSNWLTYFTNTKLFYQGELDYRPQIPGYLDSNGEFMVIYTGQSIRDQVNFCSHMENTKRTAQYKKFRKITSEILFPKRHRNQFPHIRVRYEILQNLREVRVIPRGNYYEIEIRYKRFVEDIGLTKDNAISIDLGSRNPFTIVNNLGLRPILLQGRELKRVNHFVNSKNPYCSSIRSVYEDILKKSKKSKKIILEIIQEKRQKYLKNFIWKEDISNIVLNNPTMTYSQFSSLHGKSKKLKSSFNYLKKLTDAKIKKNAKLIINDYLFYEKNELNRKLNICDDLELALKKKLENTHVQLVKDLHHQNQTILDGIWKIYRNKTRDATHKMSRYVIDYCKRHDIGTIVIGYNEGWKTRSKLSKTVNRRFIPLPFYKIIQSIKYKAILIGINVIVQEESYTSKCSALDKESIEFHLDYDGIRNPIIQGKDNKSHKHYGQFYSYKSDKYIHSDVNGAFNIGRKGSSSLFDGIPQSWMLIPPKRIAVT